MTADGVRWHGPLIVPAEAPVFALAPRAYIFVPRLSFWCREDAGCRPDLDMALTAVSVAARIETADAP